MLSNFPISLLCGYLSWILNLKYLRSILRNVVLSQSMRYLLPLKLFLWVLSKYWVLTQINWSTTPSHNYLMTTMAPYRYLSALGLLLELNSLLLNITGSAITSRTVNSWWKILVGMSRKPIYLWNFFKDNSSWTLVIYYVSGRDNESLL